MNSPYRYFMSWALLLVSFAGVALGGVWCLLGPFAKFIIHPILDLVGPDPFAPNTLAPNTRVPDPQKANQPKLAPHQADPFAPNPHESEPAHFLSSQNHSQTDPISHKSLYQIALLGIFPILIFYFLFLLLHLDRFSTWELIISSVAYGASLGAIGITAAHELIHRPRALERAIGTFLLTLSSIPHWGLEHVHSHHKNVGLRNDAATARRHETLYWFWMRNYFSGLKHAARIKPHQFIRLQLLWLILLLVLGVTFGGKGLLVFAISSATASALLFSVDYIEHYGLTRDEISGSGRPEPVAPHHSWDSGHPWTNSCLFNLGLHSHHHRRASVPFERLSLETSSRKLPLGYSGMVCLALVPPLFFKVMNRRLDLAKNRSNSDGPEAPAPDAV